LDENELTIKTGKQLLSAITILLTSLSAFGQQKANPEVVSQEKLIQKKGLRTHQVVHSSNDPDPVENTAEESVFYSISNPASFVVNQEPEVELTKEQKIAKLEQQIESVEAKIFLLNEDPISNEQEIVEKEMHLSALIQELDLLKSE
jgi:hypothetical protein